MSEDFCAVYSLKCRVTNKVYVGSAVKVGRRLKFHMFALLGNRHSNKYLQNAWNKHGAEEFSCEVLESCAVELRLVREQHWIERLRSNDEKFGFNLAFPVRSAAPSERMSAIHKERWGSAEFRDKALPIVTAALAKAHEQWRDPIRRLELESIVKNNAKKAHARWHDDPEYQERRRLQLIDASAKARKRFRNDSEHHDKMVARLRSQGKAASDRAKELYETDPVFRAAEVARRNMPEYRAKMSQQSKKRTRQSRKDHGKRIAELWADPVWRAKMMQARSKN